MTKRILAETPNGLQVEITAISDQPGKVDIKASDDIFYRYDPYPYKSRYGTVQLDWLKNIHVEEDPFTGDAEANDPPTEPEYDPAWEWYEMTSAMRRGEA